MTDDQFERIKKGLNFHSEGGVYNLCTLTETTLRTIIEDAVKFYEKQQKIDALHIMELQKQNGELTDELKTLRESIKDYGAGCYENGLRNGRRKLEAQIEKMKCCGNCKFGYKCSLFSTQIHKENGVEYQTQAKWNKEKEKYCNVGYSGKYECWEIKEK